MIGQSASQGDRINTITTVFEHNYYTSRAGSDVIQRLLQLGLLVTDSPKGQIRFGVPLAGLRFLFPSLWPEAEADAELARGEAATR